MVKNSDIYALIKLYRYYINQANICFDIYPDLVNAYFMFDFYMEMASIYENAILNHI